MVHDGNDVLTDDELVVVRKFLKKSKHACLYIQNEFSRGFRLLNHIWGYYFKWVKKRLTYSCHHIIKSLKRLMWLIWLVLLDENSQQENLYWVLAVWSVSSISPFIVAISTLAEYRRSFVSRLDLFCNSKKIVAPTLETKVQRVFKGFLQFFKLSYKAFRPLPSRIKDRMFKNWVHVFVNLLDKQKVAQGISRNKYRGPSIK